MFELNKVAQIKEQQKKVEQIIRLCLLTIASEKDKQFTVESLVERVKDYAFYVTHERISSDTISRAFRNMREKHSLPIVGGGLMFSCSGLPVVLTSEIPADKRYKVFTAKLGDDKAMIKEKEKPIQGDLFNGK